MMTTIIIYTILSACSILCVNAYVGPISKSSNALDLSLYEEVIDLAECERQLAYIVANNSALRNRFMDAGFRFPPRSILRGNTRDTGNYFQCLDISEKVDDMDIGGKYCPIQIPLRQDNFELPSLPDLVLPDIPWPNITLPDIPWPEIPWYELDEKTTHYSAEIRAGIRAFERAKYSAHNMLGEDSRVSAESPVAGMNVELAFCIPKVCTAKHALDVLTSNLTANLTTKEVFCRLPNDKPWVPVDYVAVILFSTIGLLTLLSTVYDLRHTIILKRDPKKANKICTLFSIYTNTKNFFIFPSNPSAITCLDGIRSFAMMWVIVGHTFVTQLSYIPENPLDIVNFMRSFWGLWITSATITVDTFFMISGLLLVYTTAAKVTRISLFKKLHLFYLNRILRMFPILGAMVLIEASFLHKTADGPYWHLVAKNTNDCRVYWWTTLLYVHNWVNPSNMCLSHTWYLAIDMQLHIVAPLVLFWILGQRSLMAWTAMCVSLIAVMAGATTYNFINEFQSAVISLARSTEEGNRYLTQYYVHTLNRISPFIVGMMIGYVLHLYRAKSVRMPWVIAGLIWVVAGAASTTVIIITYFNIQPDWDNQLADNIINSTIRPVWAASVGWFVFACKHGYGGPVNWLLSLHIFKILGRLSYAMYIVHFPLIYLTNATALQPIYFGVNYSMYKFSTDFILATIGAFLLTITIDFPFTGIIKMLIGGGPRPPRKEPPAVEKEPELGFRAVSVVENSFADDDIKKTRM